MLFSKFFLSCGHIILGVRHDLEILLCKNTITRMTHMGNGNILQRKKKNIYSHKDNRRAHTNCGILSLVYPYFNCISELILIQVPAANHFLCNFHVIWIINKIGNAEQHLPRQLVCVVGPTELIGNGGKFFDQYCGLLQEQYFYSTAEEDYSAGQKASLRFLPTLCRPDDRYQLSRYVLLSLSLLLYLLSYAFPGSLTLMSLGERSNQL